MPELDTIDDIREIATDLLRRADALEVLPTPVEDLLAAAGLEQSDVWLTDSRIGAATGQVRKLLRASRLVLGTLDRRDRVIYVSPAVDGTARGQFVKLHETMHDQLWWQDLTIFADSAQTLAPSVDRIFEREANQGAAELLFQRDFFTRVARDYPTDLSTPAELATLFGASVHASVRRWTEHHHRPVCVAVLGAEPTVEAPLRFRREYVVQSPAWRTTFGNPWPGTTVTAARMPFLANLVDPFSPGINVAWEVLDRNGEPRHLRVQSLSTGFNTFVMFAGPGRDSFVARHRKTATLVVAR